MIWLKEYFKKNLELIESEANIFKKVGPALIKMSKNDIETEVKGRIEFLQKRL